MTTSIKLQSPDFDDDQTASGTGDEIPLPVNPTQHQGASMATILTLFSGNNKVLDLGQLREGISLSGVITQKFCDDHTFIYNANTLSNVDPITVRDLIRLTRAEWPAEDVTHSDWGSSTLDSDEQDPNTNRSKATARLIYDKTHYDSATDSFDNSSFANFFIYGAVGEFNFQRQAAHGRTLVGYTLTFLPGQVATS